MDNTITALKNLYVALGGDLTDVANKVTIPDMINAIATVAVSGGDLPAVSSTDNGDVLTVVEGAWAKAALPTPDPELPAVTAEDNGKILKVVDGVWALGDDETTIG